MNHALDNAMRYGCTAEELAVHVQHDEHGMDVLRHWLAHSAREHYIDPVWL